jgi:hypothetical protein
MNRRLRAVLRPEWPRLGWLAEVPLAGGEVEVAHGPYVVVDPAASPQWLAACVWDGSFAQGAFHRTQHVFGSGVRLDQDGVHFVPASTTIERLVYVREPDRVLVSNSVPLLCARIGARLRSDYDYVGFSESGCFGINEYGHELAVEHPTHPFLLQVIYDSLVVSTDTLALRRRSAPRTFTSYDDYVGAVTDVTRRLLENARDPARKRGVSVVTNTSRGYDSPAVSALVSSVTKGTSYSAAKSNSRIPSALVRLMDSNVLDDDGSEIARTLGLDSTHLDLDLSRVPADIERWIWASGQLAPELVFWRIIADAKASTDLTLWFGGYFGDGMWDVGSGPAVLAGFMYRGAPSGYSLAEARLAYGIIDCSLPYLFGEDASSVHAISISEEMAPWRVGNGYDRPIARRLVESRGVAREAFGFGKKAVAQDFDAPQGDELRGHFAQASGWSRLGSDTYRALNLGIYLTGRSLAFVRAGGKRARMLKSGGRGDKNLLRRLGPQWDLRRATFIFCVNGLIDSLRTDSAERG